MELSDKVLDLVKQRVGQYKTRGNETIFQDCPFCGNSKANFELNMVKGVFHCWACSEAGGVRWLLRKLDIQYDGPLPTFQKQVAEVKPEVAGEFKLPDGLVAIDQCDDLSKVMGYLGGRGITKDDVKTYGILWWKDNGRVLFPFRNSVGNLIFWTARTIYKNVRPKYFHASVSKTDRVIMYHGQDKDNSVFICEGVFDAIRLNKMGKTVVILMGSSISDTLKDYLRSGKQNVVLVLDQDAANKQLEYQGELERWLGRDKVRAIYLSQLDVAAVGLVGGEGFSGYVRSKLGKGGLDNGSQQDKGAGAL